MHRHFFFRNYGWLALAFASISVFATLRVANKYEAEIICSTIAVALGFCYFIQQQKLAETELFHKLFTDFNIRYSELNGRLSALLPERTLSQEQTDIVVDYFNLCAEEYLFYRQGYIPQTVWRAWCRGMIWYLNRHPFRDIWNEEVKTESFYGLSLKEIQAGAA